jgi:hypothetical protein
MGRDFQSVAWPSAWGKGDSAVCCSSNNGGLEQRRSWPSLAEAAGTAVQNRRTTTDHLSQVSACDSTWMLGSGCHFYRVARVTLLDFIWKEAAFW